MSRKNYILPDELANDFATYCEMNNLTQTEVIKHLVRTEIYHEQSLAQKRVLLVVFRDGKGYKVEDNGQPLKTDGFLDIISLNEFNKTVVITSRNNKQIKVDVRDIPLLEKPFGVTLMRLEKGDEVVGVTLE